MTEPRQLDYLRHAITTAAGSGYLDEDAVRERIEEQVRDELRDEPPDERERLTVALLEELDAALAEQRSLEATWTEATDNDRIEAAFEALRAEGIVALENAGYTMSDGWEDIHEARRRAPGAWGGVFFHGQDVERGVRGGGLDLAFGAFAGGDAHEPESLRLAARVREVLGAHGVATEWDGTIKRRIRLAPFEWRKRRHSRRPG